MNNLNQKESAMAPLILPLIMMFFSYAVCGDLDEFRIKRAETFEFVQKPFISGASTDTIKFSFEVRDYCDVTVAIEDIHGNIIRHLASGVLGSNAPWPLQSNSLAQNLAWDLLDDQGARTNPDSAVLRVSLGLRASYEKTLYGDPKRRITGDVPLFTVAPEGVYLYMSLGQSNLVLFDHNGDYVKTLYPFAADKLKDVVGLNWVRPPQISDSLPWKIGNWKQTFLNCNNLPHAYEWKSGPAVSAMANAKGRIALARQNLARLASDGASGGLLLNGPAVNSLDTAKRYNPMDAAMSPDAKKVYCAGFYQRGGDYGNSMDSLTFMPNPVVTRMDYEGASAGAVFSGPSKGLAWQLPVSVCCDSAGRVYVADYLAHCVYILDSGGALLKQFNALYPAEVRINPRNQEIYVFSWFLDRKVTSTTVINATMIRFGTFDNPSPIDTVLIPQAGYAAASRQSMTYGNRFRAEIDPWADTLTVWLGREKNQWSGISYDSLGALLLVPRNGQMAVKRDFSVDARKNVDIIGSYPGLTTFLAVNPKTGKLYINERGAGIVEVDPETGSHRRIKNAFYGGVWDFTFGYDGLLYFRTYGSNDTDYIARSSSVDLFQEAPLPQGAWAHPYNLAKDATGVYKVPPRGDSDYSPGMSVSPRGKLAVPSVKPWQPRPYPGRPSGFVWGIKVWDKLGNVIDSDAVAGIPRTFGLLVDDNLNAFVMDGAQRILDGTPYFPGVSTAKYTNTMLGCRVGRGRILSTNTAVPMQADSVPKEPYDLCGIEGALFWTKDIDWMFGGGGFGYSSGSGGWLNCPCGQSNAGFDYFSRSFIPESDIYRVAVLDARGNLIMHIGRYGNADSRGPNSAVPLGGDEVGLFQPTNVAMQTDKKLYIADMGNLRILSVALGYETEERVAVGRLAIENIPLTNHDVRFTVSPNPFSASTRIEYSLTRGTKVSLKVFSMKGDLVATLTDGNQASGRHTAIVRGDRFPSACYLIRLDLGGRAHNRKMVILR